jgi:hypothetical protein
MDGSRYAHVELDLQVGVEPMTGRAYTTRDGQLEFRGVLELLGLLDDARVAQPAAGTSTPDRRAN